MSLKVQVGTGVFGQKLGVKNRVEGLGSENQLMRMQGLALTPSLAILLSSLSICRAGVEEK